MTERFPPVCHDVTLTATSKKRDASGDRGPVAIPDGAPLDFGRLLVMAEGDQRMVRHLIDDALALLPARMVQLDAAITEGPSEDLAKQAYRLWGTLLQMAAPGAADAARLLYAVVTSEDDEAMPSAYAALVSEVDRLLDAMQAWASAKAGLPNVTMP